MNSSELKCKINQDTFDFCKIIRSCKDMDQLSNCANFIPKLVLKWINLINVIEDEDIKSKILENYVQPNKQFICTAYTETEAIILSNTTNIGL